MDRNMTDFLHLREVPLLTLITEVTTGFMFVNVATIKKIHNEDYVDVSLYWKDNMGNETVIPDVRLLKLGTNKVKIFIEPEVGDNVLLICPRDFVEKLEFSRIPKNIEFAQNVYSSQNMCAILIKDESNENAKTTVNIDPEGNITVSTDGDANVTASNIILNGGEENSHLVRYEELEKGLGELWSVIKTHTHPYIDDGASATTSPSADLADEELDIIDAKIDTILTESSSS